MFPVRASVYKRWRGCTQFYGWFCRKIVPDYKKFTETFFKIEVISDCRYIVKDTDVETDKEIVHRYQTQEDAWNAAMLCANRQTFDLSVKMPGSVHMSVNYKEQTISVIGSDNQVKRLYKVTTVQIAIQNGHLCHVRRSVCDIIGGQPKTN